MNIGVRVKKGEKYATVRYIGEIADYKGKWIGVEWDNENDGKHDGSINGKIYFQTRFSKNGSFVREETLNLGNDILTEIFNRYGDNSELGMYEFGNREVKLVGMEKVRNKQSNVFNLKHVVLDFKAVAYPPPDDTPPFTNCIELNLHSNLLYDWNTVRQILKCFPNLKELVLRKNRFLNVEQCNESSESLSTSLRTIILNDCILTPSTISWVLSLLPSVNTVFALRNELSFFSPTVEIATRLTSLDLQGNSFNSLTKLHGVYENLIKLNVCNCGISNITAEDSERFPRLTTLSLNQNIINSWFSVNALSCFKSLSVLNIDAINFKVVSEISVNEVITAKIPELVDINHFDINSVERLSAEIRFIGKYLPLSEEDRKEHQDDLNRLIKIHGLPALTTGLTKGLSVLSLTILYQDQKLQKALPLSMTIQKLTNIICRMFSLDARTCTLKLDKLGFLVDLDNPSRNLQFYSPECNDIIRIYS